jgi:hypothetical protein
MAIYKYQAYLQQNSSTEFDQVYEASATTPKSAIYRCEGCGREAISTAGHPLPPQNHHQHTAQQGRIRWKMIVMATHA